VLQGPRLGRLIEGALPANAGKMHLGGVTWHLRAIADLVTDAPVEAINPGDIVEVRSGELIPADGVVIAGRSAVNQALLTGESMPKEVEPGHAVHAGCRDATQRAQDAHVAADSVHGSVPQQGLVQNLKRVLGS